MRSNKEVKKTVKEAYAKIATAVEYHIKESDKAEVLTVEQFFQKRMVGK